MSWTTSQCSLERGGAGYSAGDPPHVSIASGVHDRARLADRCELLGGLTHPKHV